MTKEKTEKPGEQERTEGIKEDTKAKESFSWKRLLILIAIVVVTAGVIFGITWYFLEKMTREEQEASENLRVTLQDQIDELRGKLTSSTDQVSTTSDEQKYTNDEYGFQMTFPENWVGYKLMEQSVEGALQTWYVELPTTDPIWAEASSTNDAGYTSIFAFSAYTDTQWAEDQAGPMTSNYLGKIGDYTYGYSQAQAAPEDMIDKFDDIKSIVATFKAK